MRMFEHMDYSPTDWIVETNIDFDIWEFKKKKS